MARLLVIDSHERSGVPFLRGILVRSLQKAGLGFDEAYALATTVRDELRNATEVTNEELRNRVLPLLEAHGPSIVGRYQGPIPAPPTPRVLYADGLAEPFSRGRHRQNLLSCGLTAEQAMIISVRIHDHLLNQHIAAIEYRELQALTYRYLDKDIGGEAAQQYLVWEQFQQSDRPLIVLIGGTSGTGKSTIATELAHQLAIVRTQSSDMLREVMRIMIPERLLPVLHTSSFLAWHTLPVQNLKSSDDDAIIAEGYLMQSGLLSVACEAVIQRALEERVSLILEGVHVNPSLLSRIDADADAIVVMLTLGVLSQTQLRKRFKRRGKRVEDRRAKGYIDHFDSIWRLQSHLLSAADQSGVTLIVNDDLELAVQQTIALIVRHLADQFHGTPAEVFR